MSNPDRATDPVTHDFFFKGKVSVYQHRRGYRFSLDAPILSDFLTASREPALEVGTGCGVISLLALYQKKFPAVTGIEVQPKLAELAAYNAEKNGFADRLRIVAGDFRQIYGEFSGIKYIFSNPPFEKVGRGRLSRNEEIRLAKFEVALTLNEMIEKSAAILAPGGILCLIFPFPRFSEAKTVGAGSGLNLARLRVVRPFAESEPDRVLVEWHKGETVLTELPPLVVFREKGIYTAEMEDIFSGRG